MNDLEVRENNLPSIKEWNGQRVVTFKDIDEVHNRPKGTTSRNFKANRKHFVENKHFYIVTRKQSNGRNSSIGNIPPKGLTLLTERGYLLIAKSLTDDLSWKVQDMLIESYFRQKEAVGAVEEQQPTIETICRPVSLIDAPVRSDAYRRNRNKLAAICEHNGIQRKELYSHILRNLDGDFDLEAARELYKRDKGHYPKYAMDVVWYFNNLTEAAERLINELMEQCG